MGKVRRGLPSRPKRRSYRTHEPKWMHGHPGGRHHILKHQKRKWQKISVRQNRERTQVLAYTNSFLDQLHFVGPRPTTMTAFGSSMPFQGWGQTEEHEWYFRFRYDSAYLEVRRYLPEDALDPENFPYGFETLLAASRHNVTGHPYRGDLTLMAAQSLFRSLWAQLAPPAPGTTHLEILGAQVDALTAYYDTKPEPAIFVA